MQPRVRRCVLLGGLILALAAAAPAADWPTYRHDSQRSGIAAEPLKTPLAEAWVFTPLAGPSHAWGDPQPKPVEKILELPRMRFDDAFHATAAGGLVTFGSSSEGKVYALDAATGAVRWEFYAEGPVRLAPTLAGGKVYVGSDDGRVYCLNAADGRPVWTFDAAPSPERILGNGRMISLWPVRTGVVVEGGTAYFGAGVFPAEGLYLYAVDAATGRLLWKNDSYGQGGQGTISPQGYLVASTDKLFMPSGRAMPAAFARADGAFLFHRNMTWRDIGLFGGTNISVAGDIIFSASEQIIGASAANGTLVIGEGLPASQPTEGARQIVVGKDVLYLATGKEIMAADRAAWLARMKRAVVLKVKMTGLTKQRDDLRLQARTNKNLDPQVADLQARLDKAVADHKAAQSPSDGETKWRAPCPCTDSLILAGDTLVAGGANTVMAFDAATGRATWSAPVAGKARGLAVADGRLLVSTDTGGIHCFVAGSGGPGRKVRPEVVADPFPKNADTARCALAAERIVKESGITRGYALLVGGDGRLAMELAKRTDLIIYLTVRDAARLDAARKALYAAGVYGSKVTAILQTSPDALPLADYFANLIVVENGEGVRSPKETGLQTPALPAAEVLRMLKPCGGVAYVGPLPGNSAWLTQMKDALKALGDAETQVVAAADGPARITRGPLPGAGSWTHEYGEPGNTACGDDNLVRGPIGMLWFGDPGPDRMPSRHASNASPLAVGGRLIVEGENVVQAYDAYNGLKLWERELPGALRLGLKTTTSNMVADTENVFVAIDDTCLRLDIATGRTLNTYTMPPAKNAAPDAAKKRRWTYLACSGGLLYGSSDSDCVFAVEIASGRLRWACDVPDLQPTTICLGDGRLFYVSRTVTPEQQEACLKTVPPEIRKDDRGRDIKPDVRLIVALSAETGRKNWERPQYVSDCVKIGTAGGELTAMYARNVLLLCGQPWNGHFWKEFLAGEFSRRSLIALSADDGHTLWSGRKGYRSRPLIVNDRVIAEPWSYDLYTGADTMRQHPVTGADARWQMSRPGHHCGNIAAAVGALFFRSGVTATYDLMADYGTAHFGAQRPGCWINCIPANGVVLMPEASSGCVCPFAIQCTIVFHPRKENRVWGLFSAPGSMMPVRHLAVNLGAPGDRKDAKGTLWLGFPRPKGGERLVLDVPLKADVLKTGDYFCDNADFLRMPGTDDPWIFASGCRGLTRCTVPLAEKGAAAAAYTVRLLFAEPDAAAPGRRVFDVKLQGKTVAAGLDVAKEAGGSRKPLVREFKGVQAAESLVIELDPKSPDPAPAAMPILSGFEITAETGKR